MHDVENGMFQLQRQGLEAENADFRRIASELAARIKSLRKLVQEQATLPGVRNSPRQMRRKWT